MKIVNNYGYDVDVRSNSDVIQDVTIPTGKDLEIKKGTNSAKYFVIRIYDRRDGIPFRLMEEAMQRLLQNPHQNLCMSFCLNQVRYE